MHLQLFMALMNSQLFLDQLVIISIDLLLYSWSTDGHVNHLQSVLQVLRDKQIIARLSKCEFLLEHVVLLGHVVSGRGIEVDLQKIELFFSRKCFSIIIQLIMKLVRQNSSFIWSEAYQKSFNEWKHPLNISHILVISAGTRYYIIYSDAQKHGFDYLLT